MTKSILKMWVPLSAVMVLVCMMIYGTVQTTYRSNANDPQIQMAEETVNAINGGQDPRTLLKTGDVEISTSLLPFLVIYDSNGNVIAGNGLLDGKPFTIPHGVFDFVRTHGEDILTWQPRRGVRSAIVVMRISGGPVNGFVVTGRSLRVVEEREAILVKQIFVGLLSSLAVLLVLTFIWQLIFK